jgi:pilus assembly protein CpaB
MSRHFGGSVKSRQKNRVRTLLIMSFLFLIVFSSVGAVLIYSSNSSATVQPVAVQREAKIETTQVLVPVRQIDAGTQLDPAMFRVESRPLIGINGRVVKTFEDLQGQYARSMILADHPLQAEYLTKVKPNSELTANIPEGYRAVTIRVDARSSVEGWARPGARVDVVWATQVRGQQTVVTIVQNAKVLSAEGQTRNTGTDGKEVVAGSGAPNTVTLLCPTDDATKIQLASTAGSLSLSLRGDGDRGNGSGPHSITLEDLLGRTDVSAQKEERRDGVVKIRKPNGDFEELTLQNGKLVPKS